MPGHVWAHSLQLAPALEGQEGVGQAGQGQGPCWVLSLACGASEQNRPSPARRNSRLLPKAGSKHSRRLFPHAVHSAPKSGRKAVWGGSLSGPLALSLGTR